jgi:hypothetical protein
VAVGSWSRLTDTRNHLVCGPWRAWKACYGAAWFGAPQGARAASRCRPPEQIGRMLSGDEASQLILRLVDGRYRPEQ